MIHQTLSILIIFALTLLSGGAAAADTPPGGIQKISSKGLDIEFWLDPVPGQSQNPLQAGDLADLRFRVHDQQSRQPVSPLQPGVWVDRVKPDHENLGCRERIKRYLQESLAFQADIDLNKYFLLVLNNDHTISVVDPILGISGYTQLYAQLRLPAPGADWSFGARRDRMWVSIPQTGQLTELDIDSFKVLESFDAGKNPVRVSLQPDGAYLWVGNDSLDEKQSGVTVFDPRKQTAVSFIPTGPGHHEIAFSDDSLFAYVSNSGDGTLSVIDTQKLATSTEMPAGGHPVSLAFSALAQRLYVVNEDTGRISSIARTDHQATQFFQLEPGIISLRIDPSGRWGFVPNLKTDRLTIIDLAEGRIARQLQVGTQPHQVSFTDDYAYIRSLQDPAVTLVKLSEIAGEGVPAVQRIPFGNRAPGSPPPLQAGDAGSFSLADSIVPTGEYGAVVAANQAEAVIYYYMEGMVAPMGTFSTYGRIPRALQVVDRSIHEVEKGVYGARIRIPSEGDYSVAFVLDTPWVDHCFSFSAVPDSRHPAPGPQPPKLKFDRTPTRLLAGEPLQLDFRLETENGSPAPPAEQLVVQFFHYPGHSQQRLHPVATAPGHYRVNLTARQTGLHYLFFALRTPGEKLQSLPRLALMAEAPKEVP